MAKQKYTKDTTKVVPDGFTGAGNHQVGRVNRRSSRKDYKSGASTEALAVYEYISKQTKDSRKAASEYLSDMKFEHKRKKNSSKK